MIGGGQGTDGVTTAGIAVLIDRAVGQGDVGGCIVVLKLEGANIDKTVITCYTPLVGKRCARTGAGIDRRTANKQ